MIDAYLFVAASALASNTVIRSSFGAAFPLFATQMYTALTARWASTLIGCIAIIMIPIPFILKKFVHLLLWLSVFLLIYSIRYGAKLREKSKHAPSLPTKPKVVEESKV